MSKEANKSYISQNEPQVYAFFLEYWKYLKTYYTVKDDKDWWSCFMSDMYYYVDSYSDNNLYVDLIMALYVRNIGDYHAHDIAYLSTFFKDWWNVFDTYYKPLDDELQGEFVEAITKLYDQYSKDTFFRDCIDCLYNFKMPEVKTDTSSKFMEYIYNVG